MLLFFSSLFLLLHQTTSLLSPVSGRRDANGVVLIDDLVIACHGVLIHSQLVLTFLICAEDLGTEKTLAIGTTRPMDEGELFFIDAVQPVNQGSGPVQLCVIRLDRRVKFSAYLQPYILPHATDQLDQLREHDLFSFGALDYKEPNRLHNQLLHDRFTVQPRSACRHPLPPNSPPVYCAKSTTKKILMSDIVAPMIDEFTVYGLAVPNPEQFAKTSDANWFINVARCSDMIRIAMQRVLEGVS